MNRQKRPLSRLSIVGLLALACAAPLMGRAADSGGDDAAASEDAVTSSERQAIMEALRANLKPGLANQDVQFDVSQGHFKASKAFAFLTGRHPPQGKRQARRLSWHRVSAVHRRRDLRRSRRRSPAEGERQVDRKGRRRRRNRCRVARMACDLRRAGEHLSGRRRRADRSGQGVARRGDGQPSRQSEAQAQKPPSTSRTSTKGPSTTASRPSCIVSTARSS